EVRLVRARTRMLRVQRADGSPVAGGRVQFVDTLGQAFSIDTYARSLDQWMTHTGPDKVLLLQEATTDARGELLLRGPGNGTLGLLLLGPGHRSQIVRDVVMATDEPLVVTVANGARLTGTVRPLDVVQELRQSAGPSVPPGFRLMRDLGT
ncbi:MAG TPA: hypothetical protein VK348_04920, partial [Planctomycetota bacterium]|nr:hypothetical protein [Planctomycetota bacterium]